jgi:3-hydroxybutyryl-CoA dehydrogenase
MQKIGVIGSGSMGNGIAHVFAQTGHTVLLIDVNESALQKALMTIEKNLTRQVEKGTVTEEQKNAALKNISTSTEYGSALAQCDLVVEAATENPEIKFSIFRKLDEICKPDCVLASNTSSISITKIAAQTKRPQQVIGMHFMNPVPVMKLVEVIRGYATTDEVCSRIMQKSKELGKVPVEVNDYPSGRSRRNRHGDETGHGPPHGSTPIGRLHRIGCMSRHFTGASGWFRKSEICPVPVIGKHGNGGKTRS